MAKGMMSRPPTGGGLKELSARQQRRKQYLERRGREFRPGGQVQAQPTEMPEMTARQQRRQQYLQRRDARRQRAVEDYRAQQQAQQQMPSFQPGMPLGQFLEQLPEGLDPRSNIATGEIRQDTPGLDVGMPIVPYSPEMTGGYKGSLELTPEQGQRMREFMLRGGFTNAGYGNMMGQLPAGVSQDQAIEAAMQEPMRTPTPEYVNAMPGQLRTGTFTPQGMYRPLPYNATPQQIRERQALIQGGHYFNQLPPAQRMR